MHESCIHTHVTLAHSVQCHTHAWVKSYEHIHTYTHISRQQNVSVALQNRQHAVIMSHVTHVNKSHIHIYTYYPPTERRGPIRKSTARHTHIWHAQISSVDASVFLSFTYIHIRIYTYTHVSCQQKVRPHQAISSLPYTAMWIGQVKHPRVQVYTYTYIHTTRTSRPHQKISSTPSSRTYSLQLFNHFQRRQTHLCLYQPTHPHPQPTYW